MRQVHGLMGAINNRSYQNAEFDALIHDKKLKSQSPSEEVQFTEEQDQVFSNAILEAQKRKLEERRLRNG